MSDKPVCESCLGFAFSVGVGGGSPHTGETISQRQCSHNGQGLWYGLLFHAHQHGQATTEMFRRTEVITILLDDATKSTTLT